VVSPKLIARKLDVRILVARRVADQKALLFLYSHCASVNKTCSTVMLTSDGRDVHLTRIPLKPHPITAVLVSFRSFSPTCIFLPRFKLRTMHFPGPQRDYIGFSFRITGFWTRSCKILVHFVKSGSWAGLVKIIGGRTSRFDMQ